MRKVNYLLIIGTIILLFLLAISMFPQFFTQVDPYGKQYERLSYDGGKFSGSPPPIAPCKEFPWGTDTLGRDMKSLIIYGSKATLAMASIIALGRLLIALPLSIMAAYKSKFAGWLIKEFNIVFSAFPLIIICAFFSQTNLTYELFINKMTPIVIILTIVGWGKLANVITQRVTDILSQDFIEGEISIGKNKLEIALQNILPHLIPSLIVMMFLEIAFILLSLAQIGILSTIATGMFFNMDGNMNTPLEFDWPSLFIYSYYLFGSDKMWLVIYPSLAFGVSIIGFNLFGEGLRLEFDKSSSRVISFIKKIPTALSPARLIYEMKNYKDYKGTVIKKAIAIIMIIAIIAIPGQKNLYELNAQEGIDTIEAFNQLSNDANGAIDSESIYANTISRKLKEYGMLPFEGEYLHKFIADKKQVMASSMSIDLGNQSIDLQYLEDYCISDFIPIDGTFDLEIIKADKVNDAVRSRASELQGKFVAIDYQGIDSKKSLYVSPYSLLDAKPQGVLTVIPRSYFLRQIESRKSDWGLNFIYIYSEKSELLSGINKAKINIKIQDGFKEGVNVIGYIPGCDEKLKDEYIVIGSPINYLQNSTDSYRSSEIGGVSLALDMAEAIQKYGIKPKRTIVFAFWGGDTSLSRGSYYTVKKYFKETDKTAFYIDLKDLTNMQTDDLIVDTSTVMPKSKIGQQYIETLKKYADINNMKLSFGSIESVYAKDFYDTNRQGMAISSSRRGPLFDKLYMNNGEINHEKYNKAAQMIFNTIVDMALAEDSH